MAPDATDLHKHRALVGNGVPGIGGIALHHFVAALKRWYKVWLLIGWAWPVTAMSAIYLVSREPIVLGSLLFFLVISFGVFLPVLRLRVCPSCKANELGICPFFATQ